MTVEIKSVGINAEMKCFSAHTSQDESEHLPPYDVDRDNFILAMPQAVGSWCQVDVLVWNFYNQTYKLLHKYTIYNTTAGGFLTQQRVWCFCIGGKCTSPFCVTCLLYSKGSFLSELHMSILLFNSLDSLQIPNWCPGRCSNIVPHAGTKWSLQVRQEIIY